MTLYETRALVRVVALALVTPVRWAPLALAIGITLTTGAYAPAGKAEAAPAAGAPSRVVPESVKVERDLVYARYGEREVKLDLYLPKNPASTSIPCIVTIHGGGWRAGNKMTFAPIAIRLAEQGFAAACISYRLLPEVQFPAPVQDCKAAVRWVRANAKKYGLDPDHIGAMGGSAGGHLVAMLGTSHKIAKLEGEGGSAGVSSRVQAVVAMATPADMTRFGNRATVDTATLTLVSPITHVDKDAAPILLLHGEADRLVPMQQSELLLAKYQQAAVPAELVKFPGAPHAFWNQSQWFPDTMQRAVAFFRTRLGTGTRAQ